MKKILYIMLGVFIGGVSISSAATILFPIGGGTGTSTSPTYGQLLMGNGTGVYSLVSTSSLGITAPAGSGITTLNGQTGVTQSFASSTSGSDFSIISSGDVHTFTVPTASASARGMLSSADWTTFNSKAGFSYPFPNNATSSQLTFSGATTTFTGTVFIDSHDAQLVVHTIRAHASDGLFINSVAGSPVALFGAGGGQNATFYDGTTITGLLTANGGIKMGALSGGLGANAGSFYVGATTTFSTGLTYSNGNVVCDTASASIFGCLTSAYFSVFNNKISSTSLSGTNGVTYNSSTGVIDCTASSRSATGCLSSAYFTVFDNKVSSSSLFAYPFPNNATTSSLTLGGLTLTSFSGGLGANNGLVYGAPTTTFSSGLTYSNGNVTSDLGTSIDISAETNLSATYPVILTGDALSFPATSTLYANLSAGGLYIGADKTVLSAATTTFTGTAPITATHASGIVTIACASCSSFAYPFTSATTYTGVSTSTLINFAGGVMSTASSTLQNLYSASTTLSDKTLLTNATSTNLYVGTQFFAPITRQFIIASSSLGTGTTTYKFSGFSQGATVLRVGCNSVGGGVFNAQFGDSAASSTMVQSSTGLTTTFTTVSTNNTYTTGETVWASVGGVSGTVTNPACTLEIR